MSIGLHFLLQNCSTIILYWSIVTLILSSEPNPGQGHAKELVDSIKANKPMDDLLSLVNKIPNFGSDEQAVGFMGKYCTKKLIFSIVINSTFT